MVLDLKSGEPFLTVKLATSEADLIAAQRLRYRVFVQELGANGPTVDHARARESDDFDVCYDHLLLIDRRCDAAKLDHVVGVYRLMRSDMAKAGPGFYSAGEYDLSALENSGRKLLELGRSCVDRSCRGGASMVLMWNALAEYVLAHDVEIMFGVASFHGTDTALIAQSLSYLYRNHLAPVDCRPRVRPDHYHPLDLVEADEIDRKTALAQTPALIKAYLGLGGFVGDGAYIDHAFNTVDICLVMDTARMSERHKKAYTRKSAARK